MKEFNTDKYNHGYIPIYEVYFNEKNDVKNVLEIGVYQGESLKYLSSKFDSATIYGLDIEDKTIYNSTNIKTFICDQSNREHLLDFIKNNNIEFDIIIDDGGHTMKQQQTSFGFLFQKLKKGGLYILEDLHTSRWENYGTIEKGDLITTLDMLFTLKYTKNLISNHILEDEKNYIEQNTEFVNIWTRTPEFNQSVTSIIKKR